MTDKPAVTVAPEQWRAIRDAAAKAVLLLSLNPTVRSAAEVYLRREARRRKGGRVPGWSARQHRAYRRQRDRERRETQTWIGVEYGPAERHDARRATTTDPAHERRLTTQRRRIARRAARRADR